MSLPEQIWIGRDDRSLGPHDLAALAQMHREGLVRVDDLLWWEGLGEWTERDAALPLLGIVRDAPRPAPPPLPMPTPRVEVERQAPLPEFPPSQVYRGRTPGQEARAIHGLLFGFVGLVIVAALAAAVFPLLRPSAFPVTSSGSGARAVIGALSEASPYKTAYAEFVLTTDRVPQSLADLGIESAPGGALRGVRLVDGTLLFDLAHGTLALQPFRSEQYQIQFRCALAAPPQGMKALGQIDSAAATTLSPDDLPEACR